MTSAVRATSLSKRFGDLVAVDGVDFEIQVGGCYGFLGPNGAGKTTTIKMITCVSPPTSGGLEVLGMDVDTQRPEIKNRIGVVPQGMTLDWELYARENLTTFARYHGIDTDVAEKRADELLEFTQLTPRSKSKILELSGGMQRRLLIARALMNDPELVILDEPTTGLDPQARHLVWERLRSLKRQGKTLIVTTHYMEEAAQLCDFLYVMDKGLIIAQGTPAELVARHVPPRVIEVHGAELTIEGFRKLVGDLAADVEIVGDRLLAYGHDGEAIAGRITSAGIENYGVVSRDSSLEDVFLRLTGHALVE